MRKGLAVGVLVLAGMVLPGAALACSKPAKAAAIEAGLIDWINGQRAKNGLGKLGKSAALDAAAEAHACDMATKGYFSHTGKNGSNVKTRAKAKGYASSIIVENIYKSGKAGVDNAAGYWRKSSGHWANITNRSIQDVGMAVATDGTSVYYVFVAAAPR